MRLSPSWQHPGTIGSDPTPTPLSLRVLPPHRFATQGILMTTEIAANVCLQCGTTSNRPGAQVCRRCGLRFGDAPPAAGRLPSCPICYQTVDNDGRMAALSGGGLRLSLVGHLEEHDRFPVGDDAWLETLREGDRIRIGRWTAPFDLVRRYLVTGAVEAGRGRVVQHNAVLTAMTQIRRWGRGAVIFGDMDDWREARDVVAAVMDRYHGFGPAPRH